MGDRSILYHSAWDGDGKVTNINDLPERVRGQKADFTCLGCGKPMVPKQGPEKQWHFAHKARGTCKPETYLHRYAKEVFFREYTQCLESGEPFLIGFKRNDRCVRHLADWGTTCKIISIPEWDLTKLFDTIRLERKDGQFVPDLLLSNSKTTEKMYVEIAVTHECEDSKRDSGIRIVEIRVREEEDIEFVKKHRLIAWQTFNVSFINFSPRPDDKDYCRGKCDSDKDFFYVDCNERAGIRNNITVREAEFFQIKHKPSITYARATDASPSIFTKEKFRLLVRKAGLEGVAVKSCYICEHHGIRGRDTLICNRFRSDCWSYDALRCSHFAKLGIAQLNRLVASDTVILGKHL